MLGGNLAKKNLRDIVLRIYSGKKHQQTGPLHMASSPDLGKLFLRNQAIVNATGLGFTKYIPHLPKEGTVSYLIIETTSLYVHILKVLVCTDLRLPGASRSQVCSWVLQVKA